MRLHTLRRLQAIACVALVAVGALLVAVQGLRIERNVDDSLLPDVSETAGGDGALPVWKFFPPLWSRPRLRSRVLVPDASPPHMDRLQPSYACDLFDASDGTGCEPPSVADSTPSPRVGIAYGGVLQRRKRVAVNSTGVVRAMEWAVQRAAAMAADDVAAAAAQHCEQTTVASPTGKDTDSGEQGPSPVAMELKSWTIESAWGMELGYTDDGGRTQVEYEIIVEPNRYMPQVVQHPITLGMNYIGAVSATFTRTSTTAAGGSDSEGAAVEAAASEEPGCEVNVDFKLVVSYDVDHVYNLYQATWHPVGTVHDGSVAEMGVDSAGDASTVAPANPTTSEAQEAASDGAEGVFMCYNVWNSNPPSWLWHIPRMRWDLYTKRMDHLAAIVRREAPDVVGLQEVRYDSSLAYPTEHAQITHLVQRLPGYQFVFQPANLYFDKAKFPTRDEEGPAILSRHPIIASNYVLLSRDPSDDVDEHQRLCLHAAVRFPSGVVVDVYVVHLSLSEPARNRAVVEIWEFMQRSSIGDIHMLMGDLNAEPDSPAIRYLQGFAPLPPLPHLAGGTRGQEPHPPAVLRDAWRALHPEPEPRSADADVRYNELSFPSDEPKKRIDMILAGFVGTPQPATVDEPALDGVQGNSPGYPAVKRAFLVGQDPAPGTGDRAGQGLGMVHAESPVYASDHRAVVAHYQLQRRPT